MKLVRAIVRDERLNEITTALDAANVEGVTITEAVGFGSTRRTAMYRGLPYTVMTPMKVVEVMAAEDVIDEIVKILMDHAQTGQAGDGHVMVIPIEGRFAIRTRWLHVA